VYKIEIIDLWLQKLLPQLYEQFIFANPMCERHIAWKKKVLKDMFADVSTSKCKHAKKLVMENLMSGVKNDYQF
jgi:uncharacterized protein with von Willebrand factor type A (vWA) domain